MYRRSTLSFPAATAIACGSPTSTTNRRVRVIAVQSRFRERLPFLVDQGLIERTGRGRGVRYMLSRDLYAFLGQKGVYTRQRGLDRETNKALLLKHLQNNAEAGSQLQELRQVLPALSRTQVQVLLRELLAEDCVHFVGHTSSARWFPGAAGNEHK